MKILRTLADLLAFHQAREKTQKKLVFVPTMGALHDGHLSLIKTGKNAVENPEILVSIFVNPTQFDQKEDLEKYPRSEKEDLEKLKSAGVDAVFLPEISEIYPENSASVIKKQEEKQISLPPVFSELEGATRSEHFEGVFEVVKKLFALVRPDVAVFGQKDFQQVMLIQHLQKMFFPEISLIIAPIFREKSGLAYSSRNQRFSSQQKQKVVILFETLELIRQEISQKKTSQKTVSEISQKARNFLESEKLVEKIHYIAFRSKNDFAEISGKKILQKGDTVLLSVQFAGVHLIDNMVV